MGKPFGIADANYRANPTTGAREIQQEQIVVSCVPPFIEAGKPNPRLELPDIKH
jgi:hypothetical protein